MALADRVSFLVKCPHCGNETQQIVAWLITKPSMPCPKCRGWIDLQTTDDAGNIKKIFDECELIDRAAAAASKIP